MFQPCTDARGQNRYHQAVLLATSGGSANSVPPVFFPPSFVSKTQSARSQVFRLDFPKMLTLQVRAGVPRGGTTDGRVAQDNKAAGGIIPSHVREEGQLRRRRPPAGAKNKHNGLQRIFSKTDQGFKIDSKNWIVNSANIHTTHKIVIGPQQALPLPRERQAGSSSQRQSH